jgi:hypothetical protein
MPVRSVATNAGLYQQPKTYNVVIDGNAVTTLAGTLQIQNTIGKRSQASFTVHSDTNTHFLQYQQVQIYDASGTLVFNGYITQPKEQKPGFQSSLIHTITCVDQHYLADKRRVVASYINKTCGYIVHDLINNILSQEGVTVGEIDDGLTPSLTLYPGLSLYPGGSIGLIPSATFVYCKVSEALDALAKQASASGIPYYWQIDQNKKLWFVPYTAVVNSTLVDGTQIEQVQSPCTVQRANPTYRNGQYVIGGYQQTVTQTETRNGDGNTQSWTMGYQLAAAPTITVNGVSKTVGLKGASGYNYYWAQGDPVVTQDSSGTKLTSSDTLQVVYVGQYPSIVYAQNDGQIAYQASIDGTSGIIEDVEQDDTLTSLSNGLSEAGQLLTRYAQQGVQLQFTTMQTGFSQGQLVTVNLPMHGLYSAQMLIESVQASDQIDGINIWYTVTAVQGPYDTSWVDFFSALLKQQQLSNSINVGVGTPISILQTFTGSLSLSANLTATVFACPIPSSTLYPQSTLYPC